MSCDLMNRDLGELVVDLDRDILPAARARLRSGWLTLSLAVARVSTNYVTVAFVGEVRAHLFGEGGEVLFATREHNVFNMSPESTWRGTLGYSEQLAKDTVLRIVGDGHSVAEVWVAPRPRSGALVLASHMWHAHASPDVYRPVLAEWAAMKGRPAVSENQALALLHWDP
jgi:hypothetical protein